MTEVTEVASWCETGDGSAEGIDYCHCSCYEGPYSGESEATAASAPRELSMAAASGDSGEEGEDEGRAYTPSQPPLPSG